MCVTFARKIGPSLVHIHRRPDIDKRERDRCVVRCRRWLAVQILKEAVSSACRQLVGQIATCTSLMSATRACLATKLEP